MSAIIIALLLAHADAQRPDLSAYLEPICGEVVATIAVEGRPYLLVYDCSGELGVWKVFPAEAPPAEQPWSCEDYLAEGEPPFPGCKYEGGRARP